MKPWIKEGLMTGTKFLALYVGIMIIWTLIITLSHDLGVSPGWSLLTIFVIAIFSVCLSSARAKYNLKREQGDKQ